MRERKRERGGGGREREREREIDDAVRYIEETIETYRNE